MNMDSPAIAAGCAVSMLLVAAPAGAQEQLWIGQSGSASTEEAWALAPDGAGGVYVAGYTLGHFGGASTGQEDAFLARYDAYGTRQWLQQFGTAASEYATAVVLSGSSVIAAGTTGGSLGGPNEGGSDVWLARLDGTGVQTWSHQFGTDGSDLAWGLAPDGAGGFFVAGWTDGSFHGTPAGDRDAWLAKFAASGQRAWLRQFGTGAMEDARALAEDGAGGVFIAGITGGSLAGPSHGGYDAWLARYDALATQVWVLQIGTSGQDEARALADDGAGGVFVVGQTQGVLGGSGEGGTDVWVARYDSAGNQLWIRQFGSAADDEGLAAALDGGGGVFVAGRTEGGVGGPSSGGRDAWLARLDGDGNRIWLRQLGTASDESALGMAPDSSGGIYAAGVTHGSLGGPNAGYGDVWVGRYAGSCRVDLDGSGDVTLEDFVTFRNLYVAGDLRADFDLSGGLTLEDFVQFRNAYAAGCP